MTKYWYCNLLKKDSGTPKLSMVCLSYILILCYVYSTKIKYNQIFNSTFIKLLIKMNLYSIKYKQFSRIDIQIHFVFPEAITSYRISTYSQNE